MTAADTDRAKGASTEGERGGAVQRLLDRPVSSADLAAGAEHAARAVRAAARGTAGVLIFRMGEEALAVAARSLRRITTHARACPIPHRTSGLLRGVCNIRGELVLCADLRRLLGLPEAAAAEGPAVDVDPRRMVMIGPAGDSWVFEVDSLVGIDRIDPGALAAPPVTVGHALGAFVAGLADIEGLRVTVLDEQRVLAGFRADLS